MARKILTWDQVKKKMLARLGFKQTLSKHRAEYEVARAIIDVRIRKGMSQKELADKMNTTQSAISRLERGNISPSIVFLNRLAEALGTSLHVSFGGV